jgi:DNA-binding MarR family transcriptional regulator
MSIKAPRTHREIFALISELSRAMKCCQQEAVFSEDLTFSQFFILDLVAEGGTLRLAELHKTLSVDKSTTTRLVNPLVNLGLVRREKSHHDSRAVNLTLTGKGARVRKQAWDCMSSFIGQIQKGIPEEKRSEVYEALRLFLDAMRNACTQGCFRAQESLGRA